MKEKNLLKVQYIEFPKNAEEVLGNYFACDL